MPYILLITNANVASNEIMLVNTNLKYYGRMLTRDVLSWHLVVCLDSLMVSRSLGENFDRK
jgi:hypothetical protein